MKEFVINYQIEKSSSNNEEFEKRFGTRNKSYPQ